MRLLGHVSPLSVVIFLMCLCAPALQAQTPVSHTDSFRGGGSRSKVGKRLTIVGQASGVLPGYLMLTIDFNDATNTIESGDWTLMVTRQNQDGSSSEIGRLKGTLSGGTVTFDNQKAVVAVNGIQLTIKGGAGDYARTANGWGTFGGVSQASENLRTFNGTLTLTF